MTITVLPCAQAFVPQPIPSGGGLPALSEEVTQAVFHDLAKERRLTSYLNISILEVLDFLSSLDPEDAGSLPRAFITKKCIAGSSAPKFIPLEYYKDVANHYLTTLPTKKEWQAFSHRLQQPSLDVDIRCHCEYADIHNFRRIGERIVKYMAQKGGVSEEKIRRECFTKFKLFPNGLIVGLNLDHKNYDLFFENGNLRLYRYPIQSLILSLEQEKIHPKILYKHPEQTFHDLVFNQITQPEDHACEGSDWLFTIQYQIIKNGNVLIAQEREKAKFLEENKTKESLLKAIEAYIKSHIDSSPEPFVFQIILELCEFLSQDDIAWILKKMHCVHGIFENFMTFPPKMFSLILKQVAFLESNMENTKVTPQFIDSKLILYKFIESFDFAVSIQPAKDLEDFLLQYDLLNQTQKKQAIDLFDQLLSPSKFLNKGLSALAAFNLPCYEIKVHAQRYLERGEPWLKKLGLQWLLASHAMDSTQYDSFASLVNLRILAEKEIPSNILDSLENALKGFLEFTHYREKKSVFNLAKDFASSPLPEVRSHAYMLWKERFTQSVELAEMLLFNEPGRAVSIINAFKQSFSVYDRFLVEAFLKFKDLRNEFLPLFESFQGRLKSFECFKELYPDKVVFSLLNTQVFAEAFHLLKNDAPNLSLLIEKYYNPTHFDLVAECLIANPMIDFPKHLFSYEFNPQLGVQLLNAYDCSNKKLWMKVLQGLAPDEILPAYQHAKECVSTRACLELLIQKNPSFAMEDLPGLSLQDLEYFIQVHIDKATHRQLVVSQALYCREAEHNHAFMMNQILFLKRFHFFKDHENVSKTLQFFYQENIQLLPFLIDIYKMAHDFAQVRPIFEWARAHLFKLEDPLVFINHISNKEEFTKWALVYLKNRDKANFINMDLDQFRSFVCNLHSNELLDACWAFLLQIQIVTVQNLQWAPILTNLIFRYATLEDENQQSKALPIYKDCYPVLIRSPINLNSCFIKISELFIPKIVLNLDLFNDFLMGALPSQKNVIFYQQTNLFLDELLDFILDRRLEIPHENLLDLHQHITVSLTLNLEEYREPNPLYVSIVSKLGCFSRYLKPSLVSDVVALLEKLPIRHITNDDHYELFFLYIFLKPDKSNAINRLAVAGEIYKRSDEVLKELKRCVSKESLPFLFKILTFKKHFNTESAKFQKFIILIKAEIEKVPTLKDVYLRKLQQLLEDDSST